MTRRCLLKKFILESSGDRTVSLWRPDCLHQIISHRPMTVRTPSGIDFVNSSQVNIGHDNLWRIDNFGYLVRTQIETIMRNTNNIHVQQTGMRNGKKQHQMMPLLSPCTTCVLSRLLCQWRILSRRRPDGKHRFNNLIFILLKCILRYNLNIIHQFKVETALIPKQNLLYLLLFPLFLWKTLLKILSDSI